MVNPDLDRFGRYRMAVIFIQTADGQCKIRTVLRRRVVHAVLVPGQARCIRASGEHIQIFLAIVAGKTVKEDGKLASLHAVPVGRSHDVILYSRSNGFLHIIRDTLRDERCRVICEEITRFVFLTAHNELHIRVNVRIIQLALIPGCNIETIRTQLSEQAGVVQIDGFRTSVISENAHRHAKSRAGCVKCHLHRIACRDPLIVERIRNTQTLGTDLDRTGILVNGNATACQIHMAGILTGKIRAELLEAVLILLFDIVVTPLFIEQLTSLISRAIQYNAERRTHVRIPEMVFIPCSDIVAVYSQCPELCSVVKIDLIYGRVIGKDQHVMLFCFRTIQHRYRLLTSTDPVVSTVIDNRQDTFRDLNGAVDRIDRKLACSEEHLC